MRAAPSGRYALLYPAECGPRVLFFPSADALLDFLAWWAREGRAARALSVHRRGRGGWVRVDSD